MENCLKIIIFLYLCGQSNWCLVALAVAEAGSMAATEEASINHPVTKMAKSEGRVVVLFQHYII